MSEIFLRNSFIFAKNLNLNFSEFPLYKATTDEDCVVKLRISNSSIINFTSLAIQVAGDLQQINMTASKTKIIFKIFLCHNHFKAQNNFL
jgi:hypothetical protein